MGGDYNGLAIRIHPMVHNDGGSQEIRHPPKSGRHNGRVPHPRHRRQPRRHFKRHLRRATPQLRLLRRLQQVRWPFLRLQLKASQARLPPTRRPAPWYPLRHPHKHYRH